MTHQLKKNRTLLILLSIILIGSFLRTYNLQKNLTFAPDQRRDLRLVEEVLKHHASWPLLGPVMSGGSGFRLGPFYYYFQIISAKIFGLGKVQQAYPAVFFSILSIPLLYYFLTNYFSQTASLLTTGVYAVSYFDIEYSRFAWNVNLLPFFVILFLLSFWKFLANHESTDWEWIVLAGFSLGVGVQLHAITLLLFSMIVFTCSLYLFYVEKKFAWKKLLVILCMALILNTGQLISEQQTGFANIKNFRQAFVSKSAKLDRAKEMVLDLTCNAEAYTHIISSLGGEKTCSLLYPDDSQGVSQHSSLYEKKNFVPLAGEIISLLFLILGGWFLAAYFLKETDQKKKRFLLLIILYGVFYSAIMLPVVSNFKMRYYLPITFMPFIFLSLFFDYLIKKYPNKYIWIVSVIFIILIITNMRTIHS